MNGTEKEIPASILKDDEADRKNPARKREIIKNILIVFLVIMLILTFFSNTIMNRSLAEISTDTVTDGTLTERVRGSGVAEVNQAYEIKLDDNRIVDTVFIREGLEVAEGDVLFTVGTGDSPELTEAETVLAALELDYQKSLLVVPFDYSAENQAIKNAREDLNTAISARDNALAQQGIYNSALTAYNNNKTALSKKQNELSGITATISAVDSDNYAMADAEYTGNLMALYNAYISAETDYTTAYERYEQLLGEGADTTDAKADLDAKALTRETAKSAYDSEKNTVRASLVSRMTTLENEIIALEASIGAFESGSQGTAVDINALNADVTAKQRALEDLIISLNKTQNSDNISKQIADLDLEAKQAEIEKQQKKVDEIKAECGMTEIKSEHSGVVSMVNINPGDMTVPGEPLAVIDITEGGYTVKVSVEAEKADKVSVGSKAEVINNWTGDVTAVLTEIRNDTESNSKNRILVFEVSGNVDSGTYLDLSIPCGRGEYQTIVPKSAVYEDANGSFVLVVRSESTPLGNRYFAERIDVFVAASDEVSSAVSGGDLRPGQYIITASSAPIASGDQVRMKD